MDQKSDDTATATKAVHGGKRPKDDAFGAVVPPVYHSTIYGFETFADFRRYAQGDLQDNYFYSRYANPTVAEVERKIAALEGAESAVVTSSGSAATFSSLAAICSAGDEVIASDSIYGGTTRIIKEVLARFDIHSRFIAIEDIRRLPELKSERSRVFWCETPANPINRLVDLQEASSAARAADLFTIVDNTFATPILQRPLEHGIDAVMHSATKYLGGHSDVTAGVIAGKKEFVDRVRRIALLTGATLDPSGAYLLGRGIKTLDVRVRAASNNALQFARAFRDHPKVTRVHYPGLEEDPGHKLASRQMAAFGGMVALDLAGGEATVEKLFDGLRLVRCATSLGGVETLAGYPLFSSHMGFSDEQLSATGVSEGTVRFSIGIEAVEDIIADVRQALGGSSQ